MRLFNGITHIYIFPIFLSNSNYCYSKNYICNDYRYQQCYVIYLRKKNIITIISEPFRQKTRKVLNVRVSGIIIELNYEVPNSKKYRICFKF